jgi:hypothetical protein
VGIDVGFRERNGSAREVSAVLTRGSVGSDINLFISMCFRNYRQISAMTEFNMDMDDLAQM